MATIKSLQTLIQQKHDRLGTVPGTLYARIPQAEQQVYAEILGFMGSLERDAEGFLLTSEANRRAIAGITPRLRRVFDQSDYIDAVAAFAGEYQPQMNINSDYFRRVFPDFEKPSAWAMDIVQQNRSFAVNALINTSADAEYIGPLARTVEEVVLSGAAFNDAIDQIQKIAITSPERGSKLMAYSKQIAHDSFAVTDRTYTNQLGKEMGVEWYRYSGGTIDETREFCTRRSNQYYPAKEVETWPRLKWQGKFEGTTSSNIYNYAGGYNCRHSILPVSVFSVPKERIQEAMRQGYYQPDEKVREFFGLDPEKKPAAKPPPPKPDPGTKVKKIPTVKKTPKGPKFTPARTTKEAERFAVEAGLARKANYSKTTAAGANTINKKLLAAKQKYNLEPLDQVGTNIPDARAAGMANGKNLFLNKQIFEGKKQGLRFNDKTSKRFGVADSYEGAKYAETIIDHEIGHVLADQQFGQTNGFLLVKSKAFGQSVPAAAAELRANPALIDRFWTARGDRRQVRAFVQNEKMQGEWEKIYRAEKRKWGQGKNKDFSEYAFYDSAEFFSEAYAMKQRGEKLPTEITKFLNQVTKTKITIGE